VTNLRIGTPTPSSLQHISHQVHILNDVVVTMQLHLHTFLLTQQQTPICAPSVKRQLRFLEKTWHNDMQMSNTFTFTLKNTHFVPTRDAQNNLVTINLHLSPPYILEKNLGVR